MRQNMKKIIILLLTVSLLPLYGCGGPPVSDIPMGRYVEDILDIPEDAGEIMAEFPEDDGGLIMYAQNQNSIYMYGTSNGESWEKRDTGWKLPEGCMFLSMARNGDGEIFIAAVEFEAGPIRMMRGPDAEEEEPQREDPVIGGPSSSTLRIYKAVEDNPLKEVDIKWVSGQMDVTMISDMKFLENGDMVVGQYGAGIVQYEPDGSYKRTYGDMQVEMFTVSGNKIYICNSESNSIFVYDGETYDQEATLSIDGFSAQTNIATGQSGAIYLYNSNGIFRLLPGGSIFEKVIEGDLTSLSMPNYYFHGFVETTEGTLFLISSDDATGLKLNRFTYNPDIAARPENELVVFTLYDNRTLRQAAGTFQKMHPDTKVNIQVGMGEEGATVSDIVRTLNTELMAGKGPDVIMLDGLAADNYIDKGVMLDISDLVDEELNGGKMVENVLKTFERDGKIFAVPAKFTLPLIFADAKNADAMRDIGSLADFAAANPDIGVIGDKTSETLFKVFLPGSMPGWFDGKEINEEKLAEYFAAIKKMADTPAPVLTQPERQGGRNMGNVMIRMGPIYDVGESNPNDVFNFAFGNIHTYVGKITGMRSLMGPNMACERRGDCVSLPLPGLSGNVYIPSAIAGINAKSGHIDIAKDFLKTMLSKDVQSVKLDDGFAVNVDSIEDTMETNANFYMAMSNSDTPGEMLSGGIPGLEIQQKVLEMCLAADTPYMMNNTLAEMIADEAKGYFNGDKDLDQAIADIRERTRIYLAE